MDKVGQVSHIIPYLLTAYNTSLDRVGQESGGETGIRTQGTQAHNGFRDRPVRPLRHLSPIGSNGTHLCCLGVELNYSVQREGCEIP